MLSNRLGSEFGLGFFDSGLLIIIEFKIAPGMVAWRYRSRAVKNLFVACFSRVWLQLN